jgi:5-methylcytosine-specific restriction endonuclease McrA
MKECTKCRERKDETCFYRNSAKKGGGLRAICKACHAAQLKANDWPEEALAILESQGYQCANPRCRVDLRAVVKHLDHKEPLSKGGSDNADNLQWLCAPCNVSKHAKPYAEWLTSVTEREAA